MSNELPKIGQNAIEAAIQAGNINIGDRTNVEVLGLSDYSIEQQREHASKLLESSQKHRAFTVLVPTNDEEVRIELRMLGFPVTLFGERQADRRERLRGQLSRLGVSDEEAQQLAAAAAEQVRLRLPGQGEEAGESLEALRRSERQEEVYTRASEELVAAREAIAREAFRRSTERVGSLKRRRDEEAERREADERALALYSRVQGFAVSSSVYADNRPLTVVRYSPESRFVASSSYSGGVKVWDGESLEKVSSLDRHTDRVLDLAWGVPPSQDGSVLAVGSADSTISLWKIKEGQAPSMQEEEEEEEGEGSRSQFLFSLDDHQAAVSSLAFHPTQPHLLASGSYDFSFRLWDVEARRELLLQDGHINEVKSLAFHPDGNLLATGDFAGVCLLWDLRSGQRVRSYQGHIGKILGLSCSVDGYHMASCSNDNLVRVWDLRAKVTKQASSCSSAIPGHTNLISDVRFSPYSGELLLTASFDGQVKIWRTRDDLLIKGLTGHEGRVMSADWQHDEQRVISAGFDRTMKVWTHHDDF